MLIVLQVLCVLFAVALAWEGIKGVRGIPGRGGTQTGKPLSIVLLVLAAGLAVSALTVLPALVL